MIFCIDDFSIETKNRIKNTFDINLVNINSIKNYYTLKILEKYQDNKDMLRWSNKPNILLDLIDKYDTVFYIDNDCYFVNNYDFLIEETNKGIALTPHNRSIWPNSKHSQFECLFTDGYFNAGFIAANLLGKKALEWWRDLVLWNCIIDHKTGLFLDQKYLDIMGLEFNEIVNIIKHKGCNIALWNINNINYTSIMPIFYHFSGGINNYNNLLTPKYEEFKNHIQKIELKLNQ
jgi:hypothetical protein